MASVALQRPAKALDSQNFLPQRLQFSAVGCKRIISYLNGFVKPDHGTIASIPTPSMFVEVLLSEHSSTYILSTPRGGRER